MTKSNCCYATHLTINKSSVPPGGEWAPKACQWTVIQVAAGSGYWVGSLRELEDVPDNCLSRPFVSRVWKMNQELESGTVVMASAQARGNIRASQVGALCLRFFAVEPERLTGLLTLSEQRFFAAAAVREEYSLRIFPPSNAIAAKMKELCASPNGNVASFRLQLLQIFLEAFANEIPAALPGPTGAGNAKARLEEFLRKATSSDLLYMGVSELAQMTGCTVRHLNRIFSQVVGMSFREKHTELRLARACELLAGTESKVVDIALESGYQSLSLFNLMFTRRFGLSPGKWRKTHAKRGPYSRSHQLRALWQSDFSRRLGAESDADERLCA